VVYCSHYHSNSLASFADGVTFAGGSCGLISSGIAYGRVALRLEFEHLNNERLCANAKKFALAAIVWEG
jgi:hypothetical protein